MSPEAILAYSLLASLAGLYVVGRVDAWLQQRKRRKQLEADVNAALDARTDRLMRAGMRALTPEEMLALLDDALTPRHRPITPADFRVVDRVSHAPTRFEDDNHRPTAA